MGLPPDANTSLHALAADGGSDRDLVFGLQQLLVHACQAVPSCLGVSLTLVRALMPVTLVALTSPADGHHVLSSLAVRLPSPAGSQADPDRSLTVYAAAAGAFVPIAADLLALLDLDPRRAIIDGHLDLPHADPAAAMLTGQLEAVTVVDRALGVLLDKGLPQPASRVALESLAARRNIDVAKAAGLILNTVRHPPPG